MDPTRGAQFAVSTRVLAITLALALWMASGNLALAVIDGLGQHPIRRLLIGIVLVLTIAAALWRRRAVSAALQAKPWLVVLVAVAQLSAVVADGPLDGRYKAICATSIGIATIATRARTVWLCVAVLDVGYVAAAVIASSPGQLVASGHLGAVLGTVLAYPFTALVGLGLVRLFIGFVSNAAGEIDRLRSGSPALMPALARAIQLGAAPRVALLEAPSRFVGLTNREIRVVEELAMGRRPKQIAFDWGVSLATVRKHLRLAKRKTGARTLPELAAMTTAPDWPGSSTRDT